MRKQAKALRVTAGVAVLVFLFSGCSSQSESGSGQTTPSTASSSKSSSDAANQKVFKSVTFTHKAPGTVADNQTLKIDVFGITRRGPFAELTAAVTCVTPAESLKGCNTSGVLSGDITPISYFTPAGITLVDSLNKKKYLVVRDSENRPYTSRFDQILPTGVPVQFFVNFPVPPEQVRTMEVVLPGSGQPQVTDVPVS